jgi:chromosome segregation ATPase
MIARGMTVLLALLFAATPPMASSMRAQAPTPQGAVGKQDLARSKFRDLTDRMQKLMVVLQKSDPEDSKIISVGLTFVQEKKLHTRLEHAGSLMQQDRWDDALAVMTELRKDLGRLYELLQNRNVDLRKLMEEIQKLQAFRDRVDQLAKEQGEEKSDSARVEDLQKHLAEIEAQKQRAMALIEQQEAVREQTNELGVGSAAEATRPLATKEAQLQQDTEKLAKDLEDLERQDAALKAEGAGPGEKPADAGKPGKPGKGSAKAGQAAQSMGKAQQQLGDNRPEPSLKDQEQAIESLQKTVDELDAMAEEARRELLKLPFEQLAKQQEKTQHATDTLSKDMEQSEQEGDNADGKPAPGRKRVQQAVPKQRAAAGQLKEYKPAKQKQQDAKDDLEAAKNELDEALAQLRQQLQDEVLRALEERFTAMLHAQRELSEQTKTLDKTRQNVLTASGALPAALAEKIGVVAAGETDLEVEASDALKLLEEDGTTAVFPPMVEQLRDELHGVAQRCRDQQTGEPVQAAQREVEDVLTLLIDALRRTIERKEGGECNGGGGAPPLVPVSAELKMLRYLQERVNKATKDFDGKAGEAKASDVGKAESDRLSDKQGRVRDLMRRLAVKLGKENHSEEGR